MDNIAGWIAPVATMIAATMTAANLGARFTGWGFVVFTVGSIAWTMVAVASGQQNLLWTNGFLTLVNGVGIWRWLGRQARYEDGGKAANEASATHATPTLLAFGALAGARLTGADGKAWGRVVDAMLNCEDASLAYVVITDGGVGGVGEKLYALARDEVFFCGDAISTHLTEAMIAARTPLEASAWPAAAPARPA